MRDPIPVKAGDPCPSCGGDFRAVREPSAEERARAADRTEPMPLPAHVDTASVEFRAENGALHVCRECGYQTRLPLEKKKKPQAAE